MFCASKAKRPLFVIFWGFILNLRAIYASAGDASTSFGEFSMQTAYDVIIFKFQGVQVHPLAPPCRRPWLQRGANAHSQTRHKINGINFYNIFCIKNFTKVYKTCILTILPWYKHDLLLKTSGNIENILSGPLDPYVANCVAKYIQLMRVKSSIWSHF